MKTKMNASSHKSNELHTFFMLESYDGLSVLVIGDCDGIFGGKVKLDKFL